MALPLWFFSWLSSDSSLVILHLVNSKSISIHANGQKISEENLLFYAAVGPYNWLFAQILKVAIYIVCINYMRR